MQPPDHFGSAKLEFSSIEQLTNLSIKHNSIKKLEGVDRILPDGSKVVCNSNGDVIFADYTDGSQVALHPSMVICRSSGLEHWFKTSGANWFRVN